MHLLRKYQDLLYLSGGCFVGVTIFQIAYTDAIAALAKKQGIAMASSLVLDVIAAIVGVYLFGFCAINLYSQYRKIQRRTNGKK